MLDSLRRARREGKPRSAAHGVRRMSRYSRRADEGSASAYNVAFLNEECERRRLAVLDAQQRAFYHVDDGILLSAGPVDADWSNAALDTVVGGWRKAGFVVDDVRYDSEVRKLVGYVLVRKLARLMLPPQKVNDMHDAICQLLQQPSVDIAAVATVAGLWVWGVILRRETLSIPAVFFR